MFISSGDRLSLYIHSPRLYLFIAYGLTNGGWILASCTEEFYLLLYQRNKIKKDSFPTSILLRCGSLHFILLCSYIATKIHKITSTKLRHKITNNNTQILTHPLYIQLGVLLLYYPLLLLVA